MAAEAEAFLSEIPTRFIESNLAVELESHVLPMLLGNCFELNVCHFLGEEWGVKASWDEPSDLTPVLTLSRYGRDLEGVDTRKHDVEEIPLEAFRIRVRDLEYLSEEDKRLLARADGLIDNSMLVDVWYTSNSGEDFLYDAFFLVLSHLSNLLHIQNPSSKLYIKVLLNSPHLSDLGNLMGCFLDSDHGNELYNIISESSSQPATFCGIFEIKRGNNDEVQYEY